MNVQLSKLAMLARTLPRLGLGNVATVALYRLALKSGLAARLTPDRPVAAGLLLDNVTLSPAPSGLNATAIIKRGEAIIAGRLRWFGMHEFEVGAPPDWFANPFNGVRAANIERHWAAIPDFDPSLGDVKCVWEPSRFDWFCDLVRAARVSGDHRFIDTANAFAYDWIVKNPPYRGHNWKCGQEASLRLLAVLHGALLAGALQKPSSALLTFVAVHLDRIRPSMAYAEAQDNNHGTSEAAALWIGGRFLARFGSGQQILRGASHARHGVRRLNARIRRLVMKDGSFAQHSVNYHRLFLDTMSLASVLAAEIDPERDPVDGLPEDVRARLTSAVLWLDAMAGPNGIAPIIGANDGAWLLQNAASSYSDMRPHLALAGERLAHLDLHRDAGELTRWFRKSAKDIKPPAPRRSVEFFPYGGFAVLRSGDIRAILRLPRYNFRPSHADALHLDLWVGNRCLITDAGTWSYASPSAAGDLAETQAHATVTIDRRSQMPRISRFLFGDWINGIWQDISEDHSPGVTASYSDSFGARHERTVQISEGAVTVTDRITGARSGSLLRWPLAGGGWTLTATGARNARAAVTCEPHSNPLRLEPGICSHGYLASEPTEILVVEALGSDAVFTTKIALIS
jgi:hypothetical protein